MNFSALGVKLLAANIFVEGGAQYLPAGKLQWEIRMAMASTAMKQGRPYVVFGRRCCKRKCPKIMRGVWLQSGDFMRYDREAELTLMSIVGGWANFEPPLGVMYIP